MQPLRVFLYEHGIDEYSTAEEIQAVKAFHRKQYLQEYQQERRKQIKRKEIFFSRKEFEDITHAAKQHTLRPGAFIKQCIFGYLERTYIVPDERTLSQMLLTFRNIARNINQISKKTNSAAVETLGLFDARKIQKLLRLLEDTVESALRTPADVTAFVAQCIKGNPKLRAEIAELLTRQTEGNE